MLPQVNVEDRVLVGPGFDITVFFRYIYEHLMGGDWNVFLKTLTFWWNVYSVIAIIVALLLFAGFIYAKLRLEELSEIEQEQLREAEHAWAAKYGGVVHKNDRWEEVQRYIAGNDPNAWKLAIIEADIMLEEALNRAGYVGATIGDKLKSANTTSFTTLQDAWEAHKVRNQIAHEGGDFILTKRVAQDTVLRYERVFREFDVI